MRSITVVCSDDLPRDFQLQSFLIPRIRYNTKQFYGEILKRITRRSQLRTAENPNKNPKFDAACCKNGMLLAAIKIPFRIHNNSKISDRRRIVVAVILSSYKALAWAMIHLQIFLGSHDFYVTINTTLSLYPVKLGNTFFSCL